MRFRFYTNPNWLNMSREAHSGSPLHRAVRIILLASSMCVCVFYIQSELTIKKKLWNLKGNITSSSRVLHPGWLVMGRTSAQIWCVLILGTPRKRVKRIVNKFCDARAYNISHMLFITIFWFTFHLTCESNIQKQTTHPPPKNPTTHQHNATCKLCVCVCWYVGFVRIL